MRAYGGLLHLRVYHSGATPSPPSLDSILTSLVMSTTCIWDKRRGGDALVSESFNISTSDHAGTKSHYVSPCIEYLGYLGTYYLLSRILPCMVGPRPISLALVCL